MIHTGRSSVLLLASACVLAGCEWEEWYNPGEGFVDETPTVVCAELRNTAEGACQGLPEADEDAAAPHRDLDVPTTVVLQADTLFRGAALDVLFEIDNPGEATWNGHVSASFDAECAAPDDEDLIPVHAVTLRGGSRYTREITLSCADMPLGERTLTIQLHDPDPQDVLEQTVILFELEEGEPPEAGTDGTEE